MNTQKMILSDSKLDAICGGVVDTTYKGERCIACNDHGSVFLSYMPKDMSKTKGVVVDAEQLKHVLSLKNYSQDDIDGFMSKLGEQKMCELSEKEQTIFADVYDTFVLK